MNTIETILEQLLSTGVIKLPVTIPVPDELEHSPLSEKAHKIGKRVRKQVLTRLGVPSLGTFIAHQRQAKRIRPTDLAQKAKFAREIIVQIETDRLGFFELSPKKAADLVQILELNPKIVIDYLSSTHVPDIAQRAPASFFRIDGELSEVKREELEQQSEEKRINRQNTNEHLEEFLQSFIQELSKRGLLIE